MEHRAACSAADQYIYWHLEKNYFILTIVALSSLPGPSTGLVSIGLTHYQPPPTSVWTPEQICRSADEDETQGLTQEDLVKNLSSHKLKLGLY